VELQKIITDYSSANVPQHHEDQRPVSQALAVTNHTRADTEEYTFVHSELEDD
jgi:hypothetical protein